MADHKAQLDQFMTKSGYGSPDLRVIEELYQNLEEHLHSSFSNAQGDNSHGQRPQVACQKVGIFGVGLPVHQAALKVAVFGTISSDIYHDVIWERLQVMPEYVKHELGVLEVQRLPKLRFLIRCKEFNFDWTYYQESELVRTYGTELLNAPIDFVDDYCDEATSDLIQSILKQRDIRDELSALPDASRIYSQARAWADLNGVVNEELEMQIAEALTQNYESEKSSLPSILQNLIAVSNAQEIWSISDQMWLDILQHWQNKPLQTKFNPLPTGFLVIKVTHTGCSETQSSTWLRYIETRLPTIEQALNRNMQYSTPHESKQQSIKPWLPRLIHKSTDIKSSTYEGNYIYGLTLLDLKTQDLILQTTKSQLEIIKRHESSLPGRCFITHTILTPNDLKNEEIQHGILINCRKPSARTFMTPPKPLLLEPPSNVTTSHSTTTRNGKRGKNHVNDEISHQTHSQESKPKSKLRTASDVHSRILHDARFDADEYVIGYVDRFASVPLEMRVSEWCRVKEEEGFVPESRVVYFKRRWRNGVSRDGSKGGDLEEVVVWDRKKRVDLVFGSGESVMGKSGTVDVEEKDNVVENDKEVVEGADDNEDGEV